MLLAAVVHRQHVLEDRAVGVVVEVVRPDDEGDFVEHLGQQQDAAEHGPLGLDVLRELPIEEIAGRRGSVRTTRRCHFHCDPPRLRSFVLGAQPVDRDQPPKRQTAGSRRRLSCSRCINVYLGVGADLRHDPHLQLAFDFARQAELHGVQAQFLEQAFEADLVGRAGGCRSS